MSWSLHFLGVGAAEASALGSAACVVERDGEPLLLIDCGPDTLPRYLDAYGAPPRALYLTHLHMDHVGGLEALFSRLRFGPGPAPPTRLFVHAGLVPLLQGRVADYPNVAAEGGANFWDAFVLVPCSRGFWLDGRWFDVFATRHHRPGTSFGLALRGSFAFTGDTRPIPEALGAIAALGEPIAHDCCVAANPSHTGLDDLDREYPPSLRERLWLYHYARAGDAEVMRARGYRVATAGLRLPLPDPQPDPACSG